ncbi:hypothetical protein LJC20_06205 [Eubacteriales bacterium OttesenSCG-928-M02]|nr:hypothetical protein [Eubacteriales bacterium OttesenSCG-928-M02]
MADAPKKKRFQMPSAYVIVFIALLVVVLLTYFIPVSIHHPDTGEVVYNAILDENGEIVQDAGPQPYGIWDIIIAPIKGFQDASNVGIALLMAGGFLSVLTATGGLDAGIGKMLKVLKGAPLIALMNLVFALMGTVFGFWEETLAFGLVVIPIFVRAGYDVMMGMAVMFLGATVGNMASVVNPFATGAAVAAIGDPNLTMGSGIVLRMVLFLAMYLLSTALLIRYGAKVKANPERSVLAHVDGIKTGVDNNAALPEMTGKRIASIVLFVVMILLLVIGYVPWADIGGEGVSNFVNAPIRALAKVPLLGNILGATHITPLGEWGFDEFSVLFFGGALLLLIINRLKVQDFIDQFLDGAKNLLGVVIVLSISRGIGVVMGDSSQGMSVTFVYWISNALSHLPQWVFAVFAVIAYVGIGIAMQSTSGVSGISMPILGAVAAALFAGSAIGSEGGGIVLISAFTIGLNFMCLIYPGAEVLGVSEMYGVPYSSYLKFMLTHAIPLLLLATVILSLAPYVGLVF